MKTDRELLELAAKAAGYQLEWDGSPDKWQPIYYEGKTYHSFDPLADDGDALRLAVKLRIDVNHSATIVVAEQINPHDDGCAEPCGKDPYAATRRAIARVAAAIGEGMASFPTAEEIERFAGMDGKPEWDK